MSLLSEIEGHAAAAERFRRSLLSGRLASTFLFVGPEGIGKRSFALGLAQSLLCSRVAADDPLSACDACESCRLLRAGTHPDLLLISRPAGKSFIPLELLIGSQERRMREGLCHDIGMKPFLGGRKVAIIDDADYLNQEGANALLKTLEEPPPRCTIVLIGTSAARQLPTIRSRAQIVRFPGLSAEVIANLLVKSGVASDLREAEQLAALADGSLSRAIELSDLQLRTFRASLFERLAAGPPDALRLGQEIGDLVEAAGREASAKRDRLRQVLGATAEFYRALVRGASGAEPLGDPILTQQVTRALQNSPSSELAADALQRTLQALEELNRNANTSTLLACWLEDLERGLTLQAAAK